MGILAATVANAAGAKVSPKDFMLSALRPDEERDRREFVEQLGRALGARVPDERAPRTD